MRARRPWWNLLGMAFAAAWTAGAMVVLRSPSAAGRIAGECVIGVAIAAMDLGMHEACHGNLFARRRLNRWVGFLFGLPGLMSLTAYRLYHVPHHHRQRLEDSASESLLNGTPAYLVGIPWYALRRARARLRVDMAVEYLLIAAVVAGLFAVAPAARVVELWLIPLAIAVGITSVRGWTEGIAWWLVRRHPGIIARRWMRPVNHLVCGHLEHHLFPSLPWHNLPRAVAACRAQFQPEPACRTYLEFLWDRVENRA